MTVVIALKDKKNNDVIIGSDTMVSGANTFRKMDIPKFFVKEISTGSWDKDKEKIVLGEAGSVTVLEYMKRVYKPPVWDKKKETFNTYMLNKFFPGFKKLLEDKIYVEKYEKNNSVIDLGTKLIVIYKNEIYSMFRSMGFERHTEEYVCIGSGEEVALGSLYSSRDLEPKLRVNDAVMAAGELTMYVNTDVHIDSVNELIKNTNDFACETEESEK